MPSSRSKEGKPKRRRRGKRDDAKDYRNSKQQKADTDEIKGLIENARAGRDDGRKLDAGCDDMVDYHILNLIEVANPYFYRMGLSPNVFTTLSLIFSCAAAYFVYIGAAPLGSVCWIVNYFFDSVDGNFARKYGMMSEFGDWYDHISDYIGYCLLCYAIVHSVGDLAVSLVILTALAFGVFLASFHTKNEYTGLTSLGGGCAGSMSFLDFLPTVDVSITRHYGLGMNALLTSLVLAFLPQIEDVLARWLFVT